METATPLSVNKDAKNLNLLAVFHYVVGGIGFLFSCLPFIHLAIGIGTRKPLKLSMTLPLPTLSRFVLSAEFRIFMRLFYLLVLFSLCQAQAFAGREDPLELVGDLESAVGAAARGDIPSAVRAMDALSPKPKNARQINSWSTS